MKPNENINHVVWHVSFSYLNFLIRAICVFGVVVHACKPNTHESQARDWEFEANLC